METNSNTPKHRNAKIGMGLILITFGSLLMGRNLGLEIPFWLTSWPVLLIAIGIFSGIKHQFKKPGSYILILIGTVFLIDKLIPGYQFHELIFPLIITGLGVILILRRNEHNFKHCGGWHNKQFRETH